MSTISFEPVEPLGKPESAQVDRSISLKDLPSLLSESSAGEVTRVEIDFRPRFDIFIAISEENLIKFVRRAVADINGWRFVSLAFRPVGGSPNGFTVTVEREPVGIYQAGGGAVAYAAVAVIIAAVSWAFVAWNVRKVVEVVGPGAIAEVGRGFQFAGLGLAAAVVLVGYLIAVR